MNDINKLKYPIGPHVLIDGPDESIKNRLIQTISDLPSSITQLLDNLPTQKLNNPYRPEGWNMKQVIHHLADSHMNAFIRFKLSLTEDSPTIKPYKESKWIELEPKDMDINASLKILDGVHYRWTGLLRNMEMSDFERTYYHPEMQKSVSLWYALSLYNWHSKHHFEHLKISASN